MFTKAPRSAYAAEIAARAVDDRVPRPIAWSLEWLHRSLCALRGHDAILQYERNRIFLRCTSCGYETPGWDVAHTTTLRHPVAEARGPLAAPADLAVVRKIA